MLLVPDYDEFNIYTTVDDVESYVEVLFEQGFELKEEIYRLCIEHFGESFQDIIDIFFEYNEEY
jgi:hypothetical protein